MRYQAKLLTLSRQIVSKKTYLSILVDDEFYTAYLILMLWNFLSILSFIENF